MVPLVRANRDEIRARLRIIIFLQPDGTPVVEIGGFIVKRVHGEILSQYQGNGRRCGGISPYARTVIRHTILSISDSKIVVIIFFPQ